VVARSIPCKIFITPDSFEANDPSEKEQIITPAVPLSYDQRGAKSPAPHEPLDGCAPRSKLLIQHFYKLQPGQHSCIFRIIHLSPDWRDVLFPRRV
jgi:hypothetical protein